MAKDKLFENEAALVAAFVAWAEPQGWTAYGETAGWDVLLVRNSDGLQIGVEAKMSLNAKVLCQVLEKDRPYGRGEGPDAVAVLVPDADCVTGFPYIAARLGITVVRGREKHRWQVQASKGVFSFEPKLPDDRHVWHVNELDGRSWLERAPDLRHPLPEYVPDVTGGSPSPLTLSSWKVKAIKVAILMERRGWVDRDDFKHLQIDPRRWVVAGWMAAMPEKEKGALTRYAPTEYCPAFKTQHPRNYEEIAADFEKWKPPHG